jgi:hypothetical protein
MNAFLTSLKADLLDRRLLPLVGLVLALLLAAIAYAVLGGSSSPAASASAPSTPAPQNSGVAVTAANTSGEKAVAETTDGIRVQRKGASRNPFAPLASETTTTTSSPITSSSSSSGSSGSSSTEAGGTSTGSTEEKQTEPAPKQRTVYHVTVLFGSLTPNPETKEVKLTPYSNLKLFTKLPGGNAPLVVFRGVTKGGKSATFTIVGEAIIHGNGACLPSATQCEAVDLKVGQSETFEYLAAGALTPTSYELKVAAITPIKTSAKSAKAARAGVADASWGQSQAGYDFLRGANLLQIPDLQQSSEAGVLVFVARHPHEAAAPASGPRLRFSR